MGGISTCTRRTKLLLTLGRKPTALAAKRSRHTLGPTSPPALGLVPQGAHRWSCLSPGTCPPCWRADLCLDGSPALPRPAASSLSDSRATSAAAAILALLCHHPCGDAYVCCLFSSLEHSFLKAGLSSVLFTLEPSEPRAGLATSKVFPGSE